MPAYAVPRVAEHPKLKPNTIQLVASGDLRLSANQVCWPAQKAMEEALVSAIKQAGFQVKRIHAYDSKKEHGFIDSQKMGLDVFRKVDPDAPLIVAQAVWQYSHHVLSGLMRHRGPILTVANWSGQWPGLVGLLNLNGSLTKANVKYSSLWSEDFQDAWFQSKLEAWLSKGEVKHSQTHVTPFRKSPFQPVNNGWAKHWPPNCNRNARSWGFLMKAVWGCSTPSSRIRYSIQQASSKNDSVSQRCTMKRCRLKIAKPIPFGNGSSPWA